MALWVHCPQCDQHYQFPDVTAGKQASCPRCGKLLAVAAPAPPIPNVPRLPLPVPTPPRGAPIPVDDPGEPLWAVPVPQRQSRPVAQDDQSRRPAPAAEEPAADFPATSGVPSTYYHEACGGRTTVSPEVVARFAGDPFGYIPATYCAKCRRYVGLRAVRWRGTKETVAAYRAVLRRQMHPLKILLRLLGGPLLGALLGAGVGAVANPHALLLGGLAGVVIGLPVGYFVTGIVFQVVWSMSRKKSGNAAGEPPCQN